MPPGGAVAQKGQWMEQPCDHLRIKSINREQRKVSGGRDGPIEATLRYAPQARLPPAAVALQRADVTAVVLSGLRAPNAVCACARCAGARAVAPQRYIAVIAVARNGLYERGVRVRAGTEAREHTSKNQETEHWRRALR